MFSFRKMNLLFSIIVMAGLLLAACQPALPPPAPTVDVEATVNAIVAATQAAIPTAVMAPTQAPSLTPMATATTVAGDPAAALGPPDGVDTFDSPVNFALMENKCFKSEIASGQFMMAAKGQPGVYCWTTSWPTIQDFYIETTTIMADACSAGDNFGLLFRSPSSVDGYLFGLSC